MASPDPTQQQRKRGTPLYIQVSLLTKNPDRSDSMQSNKIQSSKSNLHFAFFSFSPPIPYQSAWRNLQISLTVGSSPPPPPRDPTRKAISYQKRKEKTDPCPPFADRAVTVLSSLPNPFLLCEGVLSVSFSRFPSCPFGLSRLARWLSVCLVPCLYYVVCLFCVKGSGLLSFRF